jgi:DNA-binding CsgD family transcriptional regulator
MASRSRDLMWAGPIGAVRAEFELCRGRPAAVPEAVHTTLSLAPERECLQHTAELHWLGTRALADLALGAPGHEHTHAEGQATALLARLAERLGTSVPLGTAPGRVQADAALCAAEVARARGHAAVARWSAAVSAAEAWGHIGRSAYARWRRAEALLEHGERDQAMVDLSEAAREAARMAAGSEHKPLTREIQGLARRARVPLTGPNTAAATVPELGLTPRETEVLGLIADGLTNRQIAGSLYISEKTAEHHVSHILSKLGVPTRAAAGSVAHRAGIRQEGTTG